MKIGRGIEINVENKLLTKYILNQPVCNINIEKVETKTKTNQNDISKSKYYDDLEFTLTQSKLDEYWK